MTSAIVAGSVAAVANRSGKSIAEVFLNVDLVAIVDCSGSMDAPDSRGGRRRHDVATEELAKLQAEHPGKVGIIAFSDAAHFVPGGAPPFLGGGTDLAGALRFAKTADGTGAKFCVISDGQPNDPDEALQVARGYTSMVCTIFVGPESDVGAQDFLRRLAEATKGAFQKDHRVSLLSEKLAGLLLTAGPATP